MSLWVGVPVDESLSKANVLGLTNPPTCPLLKKKKTGTVIQVHEDWIDSWKSTPPYLVDFDYGRSRPIWGNRYNMRPTAVVPKKRATSLRFRVGDRVDCSCEDCWKPGVSSGYSVAGFGPVCLLLLLFGAVPCHPV